MAQVVSAEAPLRNPRGFHAAKVDSAGRLKLPSAVLNHLVRLHDRNLFVTKLRGTARIYTNGSWERNLDKLSSKPAVRAAVATEADRYGADVETDPQNRITLPQLLRKEMGLEDQTLHLRFYDDVVMLYTQAQYEEETRKSEAFLVEQGYREAEELGFV